MTLFHRRYFLQKSLICVVVRHLIFRNQMAAAIHRRLYIVAAAKPVLRVHPHRLGRGEGRMVFFYCGCEQRTY